jgi:hypothetical protein
MAKRDLKAEETAYRNGAGYKFFTARKTSVVLGIICILAGLLPMIDYWGPRSTTTETILGFPNGGNYFMIRTENSFFPIDARCSTRPSTCIT